MQMLETIRRKIESAQDLHSVVKTMKALAAVNIHTYEKAVQAINYYYQNIENALQIVLKENPEILKTPAKVHQEVGGMIILGAQRGMAGNFNMPNVNNIEKWLNKENIHKASSLLISTIGDRIAEQIKDIGLISKYAFDFPDFRYHLDGIIQELLLMIEKWRFEENVTKIQVFYNRPLSSSAFQPFDFQLFPLNKDWMKELSERKWNSRSIPMYNIPAGDLFNKIISQYFYISLYRAFIESMASENASRLIAMRKAEQNIEEQLEELDAQFNKQRQDSITEELLDIVAGFEALTK